MRRRAYVVWCPQCAAEWPEIDGDDSALRAGEALALSTCRRCGLVWRETVRQPLGEVRHLRRQHLKTIQKMCQAYVQARTRLEEKHRALAREVGRGNLDCIDALRQLEERISSMTPPDTSSLEARASKLEAVAAHAPPDAAAPVCPECRQAGEAFREHRRGFDVECPKCGHRLIVQLKLRR